MQHTGSRILIAGAGIGGLAAALHARQKGCAVTVLEAAPQFSEVGAGIQLGPNAMRVLAALGLEEEVLRVASLPTDLWIVQAGSGKLISRVLLGQAVRKRYGQGYACIHRADLHGLLLKAATAAGVQTIARQTLQRYESGEHEVLAWTQDAGYSADALIGADGLWSRVREQLIGDGAPRATGHAAFRALLAMEDVPVSLRSPAVRLWWGRDFHAVSYPVRAGAWCNVVLLARTPEAPSAGWDLQGDAALVQSLIRSAEPQLAALLQAACRVSGLWQRWNLFDRDPIDAAAMAAGRVALLGDAAHPMLPYLAQGAAMALEDAWMLGHSLSAGHEAPQALQHYAQARAHRNARVLTQARRNGRIFHLSGPAAVARNAVVSLQGDKVIGMPWLYGHTVQTGR